MTQACTFCRIIRGELETVFLDDGRHAVAFLDRNQAARGHVLIVSKLHRAAWHELELEAATEMAAFAHRWAGVLTRTLGVSAYNLLMNNGAAAGQDVMHAHLHITPRTDGDGYYEFGGKVQVLDERDAGDLARVLIAAR